jgi:hypothetical protein
LLGQVVQVHLMLEHARPVQLAISDCHQLLLDATAVPVPRQSQQVVRHVDRAIADQEEAHNVGRVLQRLEVAVVVEVVLGPGEEEVEQDLDHARVAARVHEGQLVVGHHHHIPAEGLKVAVDVAVAGGRCAVWEEGLGSGAVDDGVVARGQRERAGGGVEAGGGWDQSVDGLEHGGDHHQLAVESGSARAVQDVSEGAVVPRSGDVAAADEKDWRPDRPHGAGARQQHHQCQQLRHLHSPQQPLRLSARLVHGLLLCFRNGKKKKMVSTHYLGTVLRERLTSAFTVNAKKIKKNDLHKMEQAGHAPKRRRVVPAAAATGTTPRGQHRPPPLLTPSPSGLVGFLSSSEGTSVRTAFAPPPICLLRQQRLKLASRVSCRLPCAVCRVLCAV